LSDIQCFDTLESTNDEMMRQAHAGTTDGKWILAHEQTAGRGRRGREWQSQRGNLFCSTLVRFSAGQFRQAQLSFVASLAVHDVIASYVQGANVKWPNDILCTGRKIAGILLEAHTHASTAGWIVIGIGVNLAHAPQNLERPVTSIALEMGTAPPALIFAEQLASSFVQWRNAWEQVGFEPIRDAWLARAAGVGARVRVDFGSEQLLGMFEDLAPDGALILRLDSGVQRVVHAGEIFEV
jgi:BirA family transcriptional regulator, biotin operon repressor / biotin---[acetyl-CoA-carboxylase] ligase